ncbi:MAG: cytochrome-c peroxidase [Gemmataceae bacterium]
MTETFSRRMARAGLAVIICLAAAALFVRFGEFNVPARATPEIDLAKLKSEYVRPKTTPFPADDPYSKAKAHLGDMLFWDPILSGNGTQSCASCHNPGLSWTDGLRHGMGVQ